jgi:thermostable 8-oxoguanine DNA glycosylase
MALQLGFEGAVRLIGKDSIPEVLEQTLDRYREFVASLNHGTDESVVYWRIVFAILSVHTTFEANVAAYQMLRENERLPRQFKTLARWLSRVKGADGSVIQFAGQKARYLLEFDQRWREDSHPFTPNGDGSKGWRDRLQGIRGLARTKASFAVCLADPLQAEVICIDRHMARLLLGFVPKSTLPKRLYDRAERKVRALARAYKAPPFAVQWCLWDAQRGRIEPHDCLKAA